MAAAGREGAVFVANTTFACDLDGSPEVVHAGKTRVRAGHPLLTRYRSYFDPVESGVQFDVEQATAAPGERRGQRQG